MPVYDVRCKECNREWEVHRKYDAPNPSCEACGCEDVVTIWKTVPSNHTEKDPYDMLDGKIPSGKKIISGPKYSSKTTV